MHATTDASPRDPSLETPGGEPPDAAGAPRGIVEITPERLPAPADGYVDLFLEDDGGGGGDQAALRPGGAAPAAGAAGRGEPRDRAARRAIPAGRPRSVGRVLARDVAMLLAALLALGAGVAAFAPRARTEPARDEPALAPAPPAAVAQPTEKRGSARRSAPRAARTPAITPRPLATPPIGSSAPVPLDTTLREPELATMSREPGPDAPAAPVREGAEAAQPAP